MGGEGMMVGWGNDVMGAGWTWVDVVCWRGVGGR